MVGRACLQVGQDLDHYYYDYHDDHIDHYDHIEMMMIIILKDKNDTWGSNSPLRQGVEGARVLRSVMTDTPW